MKNAILLCLLAGLFISSSAFGQDDPIVLKVNGDEVPKSEFLYIYTKNNPNPSFQDDSLDDYMQLFINYKLKVMEAREKKYDTIPALVDELEQYREQLSLPYMIDQQKNEELIKQAYDRIVNEVHAAHILIRMPMNASGGPDSREYKKAMVLRKRIMDGEDFFEVAKKESDDPSAKKNGGDLGYFSAFQMVYDFEEAAFNLKPGEISEPIRTQFGYHILKVFDYRKAAGKMKGSHILVLSNSDMSDEEQAEAEKKINEIYGYLEAGQDFEELAAKYSDDKSSRNKGGQLPVFGAGAKQRMVPEFEQAFLGLANNGDYSKPVKSFYGWHIVKRLDLTPVPEFDAMKREIKLKVERDLRAKQMKESFIQQLKEQYAFKAPKEDALLEFLAAQMDSSIYFGKYEGMKDKAKDGEELMTFANQHYTLGEFDAYMVETQRKRPKKVDFLTHTKMIYKNYVDEKISAFEDTQLEGKYPEFKALMQEYRDGILVFEIMQDEIWDKASADSAGVKAYYEAHRDDFTYPTRYDGTMYRCRTKDIAAEVVNLLKVDTLDHLAIQKKVNGDLTLNCQVRRHVFNSETTDAFRMEKKGNVTYRKFKTGTNKVFEHRGEFYVFDVKKILEPRKREFHEAKGLVTAAYQTQLEEEWLKALREKYSIEIMTEALHAIESAE